MSAVSGKLPALSSAPIQLYRSKCVHAIQRSLPEEVSLHFPDQSLTSTYCGSLEVLSLLQLWLESNNTGRMEDQMNLVALAWAETNSHQ
jgi:hypothetical protein